MLVWPEAVEGPVATRCRLVSVIGQGGIDLVVIVEIKLFQGGYCRQLS